MYAAASPSRAATRARTVGPCSCERVRRRAARAVRSSVVGPVVPSASVRRRRERVLEAAEHAGALRDDGRPPVAHPAVRLERAGRLVDDGARLLDRQRVLVGRVLAHGRQADEPHARQRPDVRVDVVPQREVDDRERVRRAGPRDRERLDLEDRRRRPAARDDEVGLRRARRPGPSGPTDRTPRAAANDAARCREVAEYTSTRPTPRAAARPGWPRVGAGADEHARTSAHGGSSLSARSRASRRRTGRPRRARSGARRAWTCATPSGRAARGPDVVVALAAGRGERAPHLAGDLALAHDHRRPGPTPRRTGAR